MKILLLNGSPRGEQSNTLKITNAFLDGLCNQNDHELETIIVYNQNIQHCYGCYSCWGETQGVCVQNDDMTELLDSYIEADLVIWSFPLYYFGMPSGIKAFLDRQMPLNCPCMIENQDGSTRHSQRYDCSQQKHILISTCGFQSITNNFEALQKQFELMFDNSLITIICPEGGIFGTNEPSRPIREYYEKVKCAGQIYSATGTLPVETQNDLSIAVFEPETYMKVHNIVAGSMTLTPSSSLDKPLNENASEFMQKMVNEFTPQVRVEKPLAIEIFFDDLCNTFQLHIENNKCHLYVGHITDYITRIEISFENWKEIIDCKISISQAFIERTYKCFGDFNTILRFDDFFMVMR